MIDLRKVYTVFLTEIQGNVIKKIMRAFLSERTLQKERETIMERVASHGFGRRIFFILVSTPPFGIPLLVGKKSRLQCFHEKNGCGIIVILHRAERGHPDGGHA